MPNLTQELAEVLNRHSIDTQANTPDFVLAQYVVQCINAFAQARSHADGLKVKKEVPSVNEVQNHNPDKKNPRA
jgi:hypothetical protein